MAAVIVWVVAASGLAVDVPAVLSVRAWRLGEAVPTLGPAVLGERDVIGARPVEIVEDYPAVRLLPGRSVFAP
ncbi:MAG: hypothetical protein HY372_01300 [Candidatus Andersenbacteria bacterium]|nr:hypothetical protein [Candidatus Andersenbacteria bacterium]